MMVPIAPRFVSTLVSEPLSMHGLSPKDTVEVVGARKSTQIMHVHYGKASRGSKFDAAEALPVKYCLEDNNFQ